MTERDPSRVVVHPSHESQDHPSSDLTQPCGHPERTTEEIAEAIAHMTEVLNRQTQRFAQLIAELDNSPRTLH